MESIKREQHASAEYDDFNVFKKNFIERDLNTLDQSGRNMLQRAIVGKKFDTAKYLIDKGIDTDIVWAQKGSSILHLIAEYQDIEIAKLLLDKGADINIRDKYGNSAMWTAVFNCKGRNYEMVELFMKYQPDITTKNNAGRSPLDFAMQVNNQRLIDILQGKS